MLHLIYFAQILTEVKNYTWSKLFVKSYVFKGVLMEFFLLILNFLATSFFIIIEVI